VTWDEYRVKFLASKGFNKKEMADKIKNSEELKVDEESKFIHNDTTCTTLLVVVCAFLLINQEFWLF
jgi:hypothetical protein